jgi:hypothetical protein
MAKNKDTEAKKQPETKPKPIPGLGITREQLLGWLRAKREEQLSRPAFMTLFHDLDDWMNEGALITENPPRMVLNKIRMKIVLAASDPTRTKPLIQVFLEEYNREMVSFERKGKLEDMGMMQALMAESEEERAISLGR